MKYINFISNYIVVTENFANLLLINFTREEEKRLIKNKNKWDIISLPECQSG